MRLLGFLLGAIRQSFEKPDDPMTVAINEIVKAQLVIVLNNMGNESDEWKATIN